jgi:DcaP outer membrane protein
MRLISQCKVLVLLFLVFNLTFANAQENNENLQDSSKLFSNSFSVQSMNNDSINLERDNSPLDIAHDRGLYILSEEGNLQMRIVGSVRFSAFYDTKNLLSKNNFSTFDIPTGDDDIFVSNYYNSLGFSRIGFEVTRKISNQNIFIRIESDFAGASNNYQIRHAYGEYDNFLIGQTWSLFTNVSSLPSTVDPTGVDGSINIRTPQIRYRRDISDKLFAAVALEYSLPDLETPDSVNIEFVQTIPNVTARIRRLGKFGTIQLSGIIAPITGLSTNGNKNTSFGYGVSLSGVFKLNRTDQLFTQATYGNSIAHFLNPFRNNGQDMAYNPATSKFSGLDVVGGFISYGHLWPKNISSHLSVGAASITNRSFQPGSDFDYSYKVSLNSFWKIVEGLRIGVEGMYGERFDIDGSRGNASRIWALFYYDF